MRGGGIPIVLPEMVPEEPGHKAQKAGAGEAEVVVKYILQDSLTNLHLPARDEVLDQEYPTRHWGRYDFNVRRLEIQVLKDSPLQVIHKGNQGLYFNVWVT